MIFKLSTSAARGLLFTSFLLALGLSYLSIRNARAAHAVGLDSREGYERAVRLEPGDARNWYLLGRFWQYDFDQSDSEAALRALLTARALDPLSVDTLLELATNYDETGNTAEARSAFLEAKHLYPLSAEVAWRFGNFLLRHNELASAFREIRHAVELDPKRGAEAFSRCRRVIPDANEVLDKVIPPSSETYLAILRELTNEEQFDAALEVWSRVNALATPVSLSDVVSLTNALLQNSHAAQAAQLWQQAVRKLAAPPPSDPLGSVIWDGGFESGFSSGGLGWHFDREYKGVQMMLDREEHHSGNQSLRLLFTGRSNLSFSDACHWAQVEPGRAYQFSAWMHTKSLTTDQGVRIKLITTGVGIPIIASTREIHGDAPWTYVTLPWTAPSGSPLVQVCVSRDQSGQSDNAIQGLAWVDDVSLLPATSGSARQ